MGQFLIDKMADLAQKFIVFVIKIFDILKYNGSPMEVYLTMMISIGVAMFIAGLLIDRYLNKNKEIDEEEKEPWKIQGF